MTADEWDDCYLSIEDGHWQAALRGQSSVYLDAWARLLVAESRQEWVQGAEWWQVMLNAAKGREDV